MFFDEIRCQLDTLLHLDTILDAQAAVAFAVSIVMCSLGLDVSILQVSDFQPFLPPRYFYDTKLRHRSTAGEIALWAAVQADVGVGFRKYRSDQP